jgi:CRISPR-associated protein Cas1
MSSHRVLLLEGPRYLAIDTGRLVIRDREGTETHVLPSDIAVLVVDHPSITITSGALKALASAGCVILITDEKHMPLAEAVPLGSRERTGKRLRQQLELEKGTTQARLWQDLVTARIRSQAQVLRALGRGGALYLERMAIKVGLDDASNHEAQAAKHYWRHLWPEGFRRTKQGAEDGINSRLNYGYAIIRSVIARALAAAGLQPAIGIGHYSEENAFNLADDFIEAYRFLVEQHVAETVAQNPDAPFDAQARAKVAACVGREVKLDGQVFRLPAAVDCTIESFTRLLEAARPEKLRLAMPDCLA